GQAMCARAALEAGTQLAVDEGEEDHAGAGLHFGHDAVEMRFGPHHRPEMTHDLDIVELRDRRLGDIFERLARGIGYEVKVKPARRRSFRAQGRKRQDQPSRPRRRGPPSAWCTLSSGPRLRGGDDLAAVDKFGKSTGMISTRRIHPPPCRFRSIVYPQGMNI